MNKMIYVSGDMEVSSGSLGTEAFNTPLGSQQPYG
jgi:hypothetical protein